MPRLPLALTALALAAVLAACGRPELIADDGPERVTLALAGAPQMNAGGNAVVVQVYQLSDADPFTIIPVEEFWTGDDAVFAGTLVSRREVLLYPEEARALPLVLDERTTHVGVAADFRAPSLDGWRVVFPVGRVLSEGLGVMVRNDSLTVTGAAPAAAIPAPAGRRPRTRRRPRRRRSARPRSGRRRSSRPRSASSMAQDRRRVVWYEGMALDPHHLQQWDRAHQRALDARLRAVPPLRLGVHRARRRRRPAGRRRGGP